MGKKMLNCEMGRIALDKSLDNLGLEYLDVHYMHIPEISRLKLSIDEFYDKMYTLLNWYEEKEKEGKIRYYGLALEFMVEEPNDTKWHFEIEEIKKMADEIAGGKSHLRYVLFEYNMFVNVNEKVYHPLTKKFTTPLAKKFTSCY